jgi:hypothetical protein
MPGAMNRISAIRVCSKCPKLADLLNNLVVNTLRFLTLQSLEAASDNVFRRLVERLCDRVVALIRPVRTEDLVGPAPQKHVELTGDSLANRLVQAIVEEHGPASVGLHNAVESDLRDRDDLSHGLSPFFVFCVSHLEDERLAVLNSPKQPTFALALSSPPEVRIPGGCRQRSDTFKLPAVAKWLLIQALRAC